MKVLLKLGFSFLRHSTKGPHQFRGDEGYSRNAFVDALSAQCDGDVLPTKLRPVKIEDENEND